MKLSFAVETISPEEAMKMLSRNEGNRTISEPRQQVAEVPRGRHLLTISHGTLQHLRVSGVLPFTKIGGVIYYDYDDIKTMIESRKRNGPRPERVPVR